MGSFPCVFLCRKQDCGDHRGDGSIDQEMTRHNVAESGIVVDEARAKITSVQEIIIRYRRGKSKKNEGISRWHRKHVAVDDASLAEDVTTSGLNSFWYPLLVGIWLSKSHAQKKEAATTVSRLLHRSPDGTRSYPKVGRTGLGPFRFFPFSPENHQRLFPR